MSPARQLERATPRMVRELPSPLARIGVVLLNFCLLVVLGGAAGLLVIGFAFIGDAPVERQGHFIRWTLLMIVTGALGALSSGWVGWQLLARRRWWWGVQLVPLLVLLLWALTLPDDML